MKKKKPKEKEEDKEVTEIVGNFSERLKTLRDKAGWSQESFAHEVKIDRSYYGRIERGKANPSIAQLIRIARGLGLSLSGLFRGMGPGRKSSDS